MVFALLPPMAFCTREQVWTALLIALYEICRLPVWTRHRIVSHLMRLATIILPVVGVNTLGLVVLRQVEWAPFGFVAEHVEVCVISIVVDQLDRDVLL